MNEPKINSTNISILINLLNSLININFYTTKYSYFSLLYSIVVKLSKVFTVFIIMNVYFLLSQSSKK